MSVTNFTVHYDQFASRTDSDDAGLDADLIPLVGTVVFTAATLDGRPVMAPTLSPRPAGLKFRPFIGHIDSDGRLKSAPGGTVGVRLWANDPKFNLDRLVYRVTFNLMTEAGERLNVEGGVFDAPTEDVSVNLASVLKSADFFKSRTIAPGSVRVVDQAFVFSFGGIDLADPIDLSNITVAVTADGITDATSVGRTLLRAANSATARSAIAAEHSAAKGQPDGYAPLDGSGQIDASFLPPIFDDADGGAAVSFTLFF